MQTRTSLVNGDRPPCPVDPHHPVHCHGKYDRYANCHELIKSKWIARFLCDGKVKRDEVSFTVTREMNNIKYTQKYSAELTATTLTGKVEFVRNGETQSRDWEAKREK